jgi:PhnB protein
MDAQPHIRHGFGAVRPYLYGHAELPDFVREVFGAEELERTVHRHGGVNVEMRIGDAVLVLEAAAPGGQHPDKPRGVVYVYVPDTDAAYARALARKASSLMAPQDRPLGDRVAGVADSFGNTWWIATHAHRCV